jgi:hypothetical protein
MLRLHVVLRRRNREEHRVVHQAATNRRLVVWAEVKRIASKFVRRKAAVVKLRQQHIALRKKVHPTHRQAERQLRQHLMRQHKPVAQTAYPAILRMPVTAEQPLRLDVPQPIG